MSPVELLRCAAGGVLAGLANLVPGVSGGTMILAVGIYPRIIAAAAEVAAFRFRRSSLLPLAAVVGGALCMVVLLAGAVRDLFLARPTPLFSLFAGLTLGGAPLLWKMAGPARRPGFYAAAAVGLAAAALPTLAAAGVPQAGATGVDASAGALLLGGAAAAFAMVLPGISGSYLLLLLGLYLPYLDAMDGVRAALASGFQPAELLSAGLRAAPFFVGVVFGIAAAARLVRHFLARRRQPTLGVLLGLLLGAVIGLWPFRSASGIRFDPDGGDLAAAGAFTALGFVLAWVLGRLQPEKPPPDAAGAPRNPARPNGGERLPTPS